MNITHIPMLSLVLPVTVTESGSIDYGYYTTRGYYPGLVHTTPSSHCFTLFRSGYSPMTVVNDFTVSDVSGVILYAKNHWIVLRKGSSGINSKIYVIPDVSYADLDGKYVTVLETANTGDLYSPAASILGNALIGGSFYNSGNLTDKELFFFDPETQTKAGRIGYPSYGGIPGDSRPNDVGYLYSIAKPFAVGQRIYMHQGAIRYKGSEGENTANLVELTSGLVPVRTTQNTRDGMASSICCTDTNIFIIYRTYNGTQANATQKSQIYKFDLDFNVVAVSTTYLGTMTFDFLEKPSAVSPSSDNSVRSRSPLGIIIKHIDPNGTTHFVFDPDTLAFSNPHTMGTIGHDDWYINEADKTINEGFGKTRVSQAEYNALYMAAVSATSMPVFTTYATPVDFFGGHVIQHGGSYGIWWSAQSPKLAYQVRTVT